MKNLKILGKFKRKTINKEKKNVAENDGKKDGFVSYCIFHLIYYLSALRMKINGYYYLAFEKTDRIDRMRQMRMAFNFY